MGEAKRRREYDLSHGYENQVFPEDIPILIRKTAEELAGAYFEETGRDMMFGVVPAERVRSRAFRAHWKDPKTYSRLNWPSFVPTAKEILGHMLTRDDVSLTQKDEIYDAFLQVAADKNQLDMSEQLTAGMVH